jgi:hypothetical protein
MEFVDNSAEEEQETDDYIVPESSCSVVLQYGVCAQNMTVLEHRNV